MSVSRVLIARTASGSAISAARQNLSASRICHQHASTFDRRFLTTDCHVYPELVTDGRMFARRYAHRILLLEPWLSSE